MLASSAVDCGFDTWLGKTKDYNIGTVLYVLLPLLSMKQLGRKNKDGLAQNQDNVYEWGDMSTCVGLVQSRHHYHLIEYNWFLP